MEFFNTQSRCTGSYPFMNNKDELSINFYDVISTKEAHYIVFNTKNVTRSLPRITELPSSITNKSKCILSSHGLSPDEAKKNPKPDHFEQPLNLLPLTRCAKHGKSSFLPFDCVAKLPEYTQTTRVTPALKVSHNFYDCILEFPNPPPISSSHEKLFCRNDYLNKCYQCVTNLSVSKSVYMYKDYLFCSPSCRYKASVTHYWYKKVMNIDDDDENEGGQELKEKKTEIVPENDNSEMEGDSIFFIDL